MQAVVGCDAGHGWVRCRPWLGVMQATKSNVPEQRSSTAREITPYNRTRNPYLFMNTEYSQCNIHILGNCDYTKLICINLSQLIVQMFLVNATVVVVVDLMITLERLPVCGACVIPRGFLLRSVPNLHSSCHFRQHVEFVWVAHIVYHTTM